MHLHGHAPQLVARVRGAFPATGGHANIANPSGRTSSALTAYNGDTSKFPKIPMRRDTWGMAPQGYTVVRFRANNPGVWLIHCHMEWHVAAGLTAMIVEAPDVLQQSQSINPQMEKICKAQGVPTAGNAAGNLVDFAVLRGANTRAGANNRG